QQHKTDFSVALQYFNNVNKKKSIAFLISDFMSPYNYQKELSIVSRKHDFIGIHLFDKREQLLEDVGVMLLEDAESGETFFADTSDVKLRNEVKKQFDTRLQNVQREFGKSGAQLISMSTSANYVKELMQMFKERGVKR